MVILIAALALVQSSCAPEADFTDHLFKTYGEIPLMRGTFNQTNSADMLFLVSPEGSWSQLRIVNGMACIIAAGRSLTILDPPEKKGKEL